MSDLNHADPDSPTTLTSHGASALTGRITTPGDNSISHRALILGAMTVGRTRISGLLESGDVLSTAAALRQLGVRIENGTDGWQIYGLGLGGLLEPVAPLDLGNSSTGLGLLIGLVAPHNFLTRFIGGPTLLRHPLKPLLDALAPMGAGVIEAGEGVTIPLILRGADMAIPCRHVMAAPSHQIKSALLLAGAQIPGITTVVEPVATYDHTEKLLAEFGATVTSTTDEAGVTATSIVGMTDLSPRHVILPGDPSLAAYPLVAALVVPGSDLVIENVLVNPMRTGLIDTLLEMGGDIQFLNQRQAAGEHVADLRVRSSRLRGISVSADHASLMLDDIPALAIAAAYAQGETTIAGLAELRAQECDCLAAIAAGLAANKVTVTEGEADLSIGGVGKVSGGGQVASQGDPRIAMSFLVLGMAAQKRVTLDDVSAISASFPGFVDGMNAIGARFEGQSKGFFR